MARGPDLVHRTNPSGPPVVQQATRSWVGGCILPQNSGPQIPNGHDHWQWPSGPTVLPRCRSVPPHVPRRMCCPWIHIIPWTQPPAAICPEMCAAVPAWLYTATRPWTHWSCCWPRRRPCGLDLAWGPEWICLVWCRLVHFLFGDTYPPTFSGIKFLIFLPEHRSPRLKYSYAFQLSVFLNGNHSSACF